MKRDGTIAHGVTTIASPRDLQNKKNLTFLKNVRSSTIWRGLRQRAAILKFIFQKGSRM